MNCHGTKKYGKKSKINFSLRSKIEKALKLENEKKNDET